MTHLRRPQLPLHPVDRLPWVGLVSLFLVAGRSLQYQPPDTLVLPFFGWPLPDSCWSRRFLNFPCPGCGLTRSVVATLHGQWSNAWNLHPVGPALVTWATLQLVGHLVIFLFERKTAFNNNRSDGLQVIPNARLLIAQRLTSSRVNLGFIGLAFLASFFRWLVSLFL